MGDDVPDLYREIAASGEKPLVKRLQKQKVTDMQRLDCLFVHIHYAP
jgi:hypothetical protein